MLTYREALQQVLDAAVVLPARRVMLDQALGLVVAEHVVAADPVPPFTNSGMDGFAVRAADVAQAREHAPVCLRVLEDVPAGRVAACEVTQGTALRIMTGAPLPGGADAVVPVEDTAAAGHPSREGSWVGVEVRKPVPRGANIRLAGEDIPAGARVVESGALLRPAEIGVLAEVGCAVVQVIPRPRVAVITTGDELVDASERPGPGRIRDANAPALCAQATAFGAVPVRFSRVPDRREDMTRVLSTATAAADVVVTTGGISMGERDCVKDALEELGAERVFWRVAQKPAGPLGFWRLGGKPVFGVPGNPVAAMIVMEEYVRPMLRRMMGLSLLFRPERHGALASEWARRQSDRRLHFLRVFVREENGELRARLSGPQGSGILSSMARSNALALIPGDATAVASGGRVLLHLTDEPEDH
jgi:molybdopterin molybdotransferase